MLIRHEARFVCLECHANIGAPGARTNTFPELRGVLREDPRVQLGQDAAAMRLLAIFGLAIALAALDKTSPAPAADELSMTGSVDVGYRWISGVGGNFKIYRR